MYAGKFYCKYSDPVIRFSGHPCFVRNKTTTKNIKTTKTSQLWQDKTETIGLTYKINIKIVVIWRSFP